MIAQVSEGAATAEALAGVTDYLGMIGTRQRYDREIDTPVMPIHTSADEGGSSPTDSPRVSIKVQDLLPMPRSSEC
jgi:hypothetical protein